MLNKKITSGTVSQDSFFLFSFFSTKRGPWSQKLSQSALGWRLGSDLRVTDLRCKPKKRHTAICLGRGETQRALNSTSTRWGEGEAVRDISDVGFR